MPPNMQKRIRNEVAEVNEDTTINMMVYVPDESNTYRMIGSLTGPPDTPYAGGTFLLDIELHHNHPFAHPEIKFITRVYHPNVSSQSGAICLDVLRDKWTPAMTLRLCLMSIQSLLASPDASSPQDSVVAEVYTYDRQGFNNEAKLWTDTYANLSLNAYVDSLFEN